MNKFLKDRPIVFLDLETTGTNISTDRIVEIGLIKCISSINVIKKQFYINPEIPINPDASKITGLTDDFLKDQKIFREVAWEIFGFIKECNIAGHNIMGFDIPLLVEEFLRVNIDFPEPEIKFIDTFQVQAKLFPRTLAAVYKFYTGTEPNQESLHGALIDAGLSWEIFELQMNGNDHEFPGGVDDLHSVSTRGKIIVDYAGKLTVNGNHEIIYTFGKNIGKPVHSDLPYADWVLKGDFTRDTKRWINHAIRNKGKLRGQSTISFQ